MRRYNLLLLIKAVKNNEENYFQTHLIDIRFELSRRLTCLYISCSLLIIILKIEIVCITY